MKKVNKVISFLLAFIMLFTSTGVYASTKTRSRYTGITYTHNSKFKNKELVYGMDVSQHNGKINFKKAKRDGIEFVFIRVGYTGYTKSSFSLNLDKKYKTYIKDATRAGLKVGEFKVNCFCACTVSVHATTHRNNKIFSFFMVLIIVVIKS